MTPLRLRSIISRKFESRRARFAVHALQSGPPGRIAFKVHGPGQNFWETNVENGTYTIGRRDRRRGSRRGAEARRERRGNVIWINHDTVSNVHAELDILNGRCFLKDLDSTNGTFVEEQGEKVRFHEGYVEVEQTVYFGECRCTVQKLLDSL